MCPEAVCGECENTLILRFDVCYTTLLCKFCQDWTKIQSKHFMPEAVTVVSSEPVLLLAALCIAPPGYTGQPILQARPGKCRLLAV